MSRSTAPAETRRSPPRSPKYVTTPGLEVRQMISKVRGDVLDATGQKQVPWDNSSLVGDVYLAGGVAVTASSTPTPAPSPLPSPAQTPLAQVMDSPERQTPSGDRPGGRVPQDHRARCRISPIPR